MYVCETTRLRNLSFAHSSLLLKSQYIDDFSTVSVTCDINVVYFREEPLINVVLSIVTTLLSHHLYRDKFMILTLDGWSNIPVEMTILCFCSQRVIHVIKLMCILMLGRLECSPLQHLMILSQSHNRSARIV
jgi:hypothetical protein